MQPYINEDGETFQSQLSTNTYDPSKQLLKKTNRGNSNICIKKGVITDTHLTIVGKSEAKWAVCKSQEQGKYS